MNINVNINIFKRRRRPPLYRLQRNFLAIGIVSLFCCAFIWPSFVELYLPVWIIITYCVIMLLSSVISFYMLYQLNKVPQYMSLPVIEAQRRILRLDKIRNRLKIFEWIIAILFISVFLWILYPISLPGFLGGLCGLIIGLPIGIYRHIQINRTMRELIKEFETDSGI